MMCVRLGFHRCSDLLATLAGFGVAISSGITLVVRILLCPHCWLSVTFSQIFFPRSIEGEIAARDASRERKRTRSQGKTSSMLDSRIFTGTGVSQSRHTNPDTPSGYLLTSSPAKHTIPQETSFSYDSHIDDTELRPVRAPQSPGKDWSEEDMDIPASLPSLPPLPPIRPNRRRGADVELGGMDGMLTETNLSKHNLRTSNLNPMVHNFTSPIGMLPSSSPLSATYIWGHLRPCVWKCRWSEQGRMAYVQSPVIAVTSDTLLARARRRVSLIV